VLFLAACAGPGHSASATSTLAGTPPPTQGSLTPAPTTPATGGGIPITVYFAKASDPTLEQVFPVQRFAASSTDLEAFSIQMLIAGPTPTERSQGYFSELNSLFTGPSSVACAAPDPTGGADFTLKLNRRGPTPQQGTATLQFCRPTGSPGVGADARVQAEITATLKQFKGITHVVILDDTGHCFADLRGGDLCLK
jgi:hypothetical protein